MKAKGSHKKLIFENEELKSEGPVSIPRQPGSPYVKPHYLRICFEKLLALNCFPPVLEEELIKKGYLPEKKEFRKK